jgi:hypothetical protein
MEKSVVTNFTSIKQGLPLHTLFHYGKECLQNRFKSYLPPALLLIVVPRLVAVVVHSQHANSVVKDVRQGFFQQGPLFDQLELIFSRHLSEVLVFNVISLVLLSLGVLCLAQINTDYFEQAPLQAPSQYLKRSARLFLTKFLLVGLALTVLMVPMSLFSMFRVILLCLLAMLPIELVITHKNGFSAVFDCIRLKYVNVSKFSKWTVFSHMLSLGGLMLSTIFLWELGLSYLMDLDLTMFHGFGAWHQEVQFFGATFSRAHLIRHVLEISGEAFILTFGLPFLASLRFFSEGS